MPRKKVISASSAGNGDRPPASNSAKVLKLFLLFSQLGISSFGGGVPAWMHRAFVRHRGWLDEREFSAALALARIMPGVNVVNLAVLIGQRLKGFPGAAAGALGLIIGPSVIVIGLATLYYRFAGAPVLRAMLEGAAFAAAGLLIGMGIQSSGRMVDGFASVVQAARSIGATAILGAVFVLVGVFHLPTVATVLCAAPLSIALVFLCDKRSADGTPS
jgi:chromate transporter